MLEKKKFNGSQKIFFWLLNFLTFTLAIILIAFSYQLESLSLGCGCLAFFFTLFNSIYDIMKRISGSLSKIIRNFLIFGGMLFFGILTLGGKEWPFKIELSQALFGISIGYFVGLILIKPMTTKAFK